MGHRTIAQSNKRLPRTIRFLDSQEIEQLLASPLRTRKPKIIQLRDKALLELLFATGARVSEVTQLHIRDIGENNTITVHRKDALVSLPLSRQTYYWLAKYLERRHDQLPALFLRHDRALRQQHAPLTPRSIQRLVRWYAGLTGLSKKVTPHVIRHSLATQLLTTGTDLATLQSLLGHRSISTTRAYQGALDRQFKQTLTGYIKLKRS